MYLTDGLPRVVATLMLVFVATSGPLRSQDLGEIEDIFGSAIRSQATNALAVLGISAVPSETASTLFLDSGSDKESGVSYQSGQLGGGFNPFSGSPLYLEGYIGYSRYNPTLLFSSEEEEALLSPKWTSAAATGGIGWDFKLTEDLSLRPMAHVTLGRVQSDTSVVAQYLANELGIEDVDFLSGGGMTAGGLGASVTLDYNKRWENDYEADLTLRYTHIRLKPIAGDSDIAAEADAITAGLYSRLRIPTPLEAFGRPVRTVAEFSASALPGDQGDALQTEWLAQLGFGAEIDLEKTWVPWVTTTRLVARYTIGEKLEGYSVGLACSF